MKIYSIKNFLDSLEKICPDAEMFRGQTRDWPLLPGIGRYPHMVEGYEHWRDFHEEMIRRFLRMGRPFIKETPKYTSESWVLAQHYGLPTRLLDTSTNPLKALFFSVNDPNHDRFNGVFWAFVYMGWREDLEEEYRKFWESELVPYLPPQLNPRLTAQEGAFISYPLPENQKSLAPIDKVKSEDLILYKFIVPSSVKSKIRYELDRLGIQFRLLFPDLDGVARGIKLIDLQP